MAKFMFHSELNMGRNVINMGKEGGEFWHTMGPNNKCIINKPFPKLRFQVEASKGHVFKVLHKMFMTMREREKPIVVPSICSQQTQLKVIKVVVRQIVIRLRVLESTSWK